MLRWVGSGGVGEGSGEVEVRITGGIVVRCGRYGLGLTGNDFMSGERGRVCFGPVFTFNYSMSKYVWTSAYRHF